MSDSAPKPEQNSVARGASRMGLATLMSRIFGLVREQVFANLFGATAAADAFNIAFRIPNLLRDLFAEGAMSAAFVPNFTRALASSRSDAFRLLSGTLGFLVGVVSLISLIGIVFATPLAGLYAGSYRAIPGKFEMTVGMTQVMFPFFPFVAMAAVLMGALNALGYFFLPAFAPVLFNLASIAAGLILCPLLAHYTMVPPIYGMAAGVLIGGFFQFYVQWHQMRRLGYRPLEYSKDWLRPFAVPGVKSVLWLIVPGTVGLAATQLNILINSIYATSAGPGAVSWLNYAFRLMQFPIGVFGVSLAAATLPAVSRRVVANDRAGAANEVAKSLAMTLAVNGPAAAGLMTVGLPIIQILFQHGRFEYADAVSTSQAVFWYGAGLPGYSAVKVLVPVFYALKETRIPVGASFLMVLLNLLLNHFFQDVLHLPFWSLAAATSVTATLNALILLFALHTRLPGVVSMGLLRSFFTHTAVSVGIAFGCLETLQIVGHVFSRFPEAPLFLFWGIQIAVAIAVAGILWLVLGKLFRAEENLKFLELVLKKFRRKR